MKKILLKVLFVLAFCETAVMAADQSSGCGPGWYVFKENSFVSSALRMTTNGLSSPIVILGMTFGTSNCAKHKLVMNDKKGLHYVTHNLHNLVAEASMGQGESLAALAVTMGCGWQGQVAFNDVMKSRVDQIFGVTQRDAAEIYGDMVDVVAADEELSKVCSPVGV